MSFLFLYQKPNINESRKLNKTEIYLLPFLYNLYEFLTLSLPCTFF